MKKSINIKKDRALINLLGEVCWGFKLQNFENTFGVDFHTVEALLYKLLDQEQSGQENLYLSNSEIDILKLAFTEVEKEIEEWEFETRIGVSLEEVKRIPIFKTNAK